jgi:hypothetical protein
MNTCEIPVYPNIRKTITICKARVQILEIKIFESVRVAVYLLDSNDAVIDTTQFTIDGPEYNDWSNDDNYILKIIKQKIQTRYNIV